mmetsp:Transcript_10425/g.42444  ORF Transcript_10425/g.42444 Transcript_10425/m.42444 type:complete len:581 (+) Transcript_10425:6181-7923(+)
MGGAQPHREGLELGNAAFLGATAPCLQLGHQLLRRNIRARPHLTQLLAHGHQLVDDRARSACMGKVALHRRRNAFLVAMQPALGLLELREAFAVLATLGLDPGEFGRTGSLQAAGIAGHDLVAVRDQRFQRAGISGLDFTQAELGRCLADLGPAQHLQAADIDPADVELVGLDRELGRRRVGVVVVVQLFAADDQRPGDEVGRSVRRLEVAIAPVVADAVDDARGPERDPDHLDGPNRRADGTEQGHVDDEHQRHALPAVLAVQVVLNPVIGRAAAVLGNGFSVLGLSTVELGAFGQHLFQATGLRAVRIFLGLALGVVLAVDRHPLTGDHARRHPEPEAEEVRGDGAEIQRTVGLGAMQEDRDRSDRDVGDNQCVDDKLPGTEVRQAVFQPQQQRVQEFVHASRTSAESAMQESLDCRGTPPDSRLPACCTRAIACESARSLTDIKPTAPRRPRRSRPSHAGAATGAARPCRPVHRPARPGPCPAPRRRPAAGTPREPRQTRRQSPRFRRPAGCTSHRPAARPVSQGVQRWSGWPAAWPAVPPPPGATGAISGPGCGAACPGPSTGRRPARGRSSRPSA